MTGYHQISTVLPGWTENWMSGDWLDSTRRLEKMAETVEKLVDTLADQLANPAAAIGTYEITTRSVSGGLEVIVTTEMRRVPDAG